MSREPILFCRCDYADLVAPETRERLQAALDASGREVIAVPDLCALAARRDPLLAELAAAEALVVIACHPRAIRWLFHRGGAPLRPQAVRVFNLRETSVAQVSQALALPVAAGPVAAAPEPVDGWIPWFPVLDYDRCRNCRQCLDFCLFGVYGMGADGRVEIHRPEGCKTNCPACARICPEAAIIFPKLDEAPINGAEIDDETKVREAVRVNVAEILGADPYAALAERQRKMKARLAAEEARQRALAERRACAESRGGPDDARGSPE